MTQAAEEYTEEARDFVTMQRQAALSTLTRTPKGYPFGSMVSYDIGVNGTIIIHVSYIAEHFKNLAANARASLLIFDPLGLHNPQAYPRVTILGEFSLVSEAELDRVRNSYEKRFPESVRPDIAPNFAFMRLTPERVRWIGSFGHMGWIDGEAFCKATPDVLAYHAATIIDQINEEHAEGVADLVRAHSSFDPLEYHPQIVHLDAEGCTLCLRKAMVRELLTIQFHQIIRQPDQLKTAFGALLKEAKTRLVPT